MKKNEGKTQLLLKFLVVVVSIILIGPTSAKLMAEGTETLGPALIPIRAGSGILAAGTGLVSQPGEIKINIPAGAAIKQVLLYWEGQMENSVFVAIPGDDTISVNGYPVTGQLIGGPTLFGGKVNSWWFSSCYRADITHLNLVTPGSNTLSISNADFDTNNGAGVIVIFDDGSGNTDIQIRDGVDIAYHVFGEPRKSIVPQTFTFAPAAFDRMATLAMFFSSVAGSISTGEFRPTSIVITVNGTTTLLSNKLDGLNGDEWDTLNEPVLIPAGASWLTVQAISRDDFATGADPASFSWIAGHLSAPMVGAKGCTPGYWKQKQHFDSWVGLTRNMKFSSIFGRVITIKWSKKGKPGNVTDPTLLQALEANGGGINALARHAVAALLNANSLGAYFAYTYDQVIVEFQFAFDSGDYETTKNMFMEANESYCPLK
jgi:hypothetical protein